MRTTSGSWRVAQQLPEPARLDRQGRRRLDHPLVRRDAAVHGARVRGPAPTYGDIDGANLLDWPLDPGRACALVRRRPRRRSARPTGTAAPPLPANNNYKVFANGAERAGYQYYATGPYGTNAEPYDGRPASIQDGFNFQGDKNRSKWSTLVREIPRALDTGNVDLRPSCQAIKITHDALGQGRRGGVPRRRGQPAQAGRPGGLRGRQLDRVAAAAAAQRQSLHSRTGWPTPPARSAATTCGT